MKIIEHKSASYAPRTYANAARAHLTIAMALDFASAGEILTHKAAGDDYIAIGLNGCPIMAAREVFKACRATAGPVVLNIAGNGIYTLSKRDKGMTQDVLNKWVYDVLKLVSDHWEVKMIVSGGQTGVDLAGGVAAEMLNIPCEMTMPKGYKQRHEDGKDVEHTEQEILTQVAYWKGVLSRDLFFDDITQ